MQYCPKCGRKHNDSVVTCDCGYVLKPTESRKFSKTYNSSFNKYPALYSISTAMKIIGWIVGVIILGIIVYFILFSPNNGLINFIFAGVVFIVGIFIFLQFMAFSEIIKLFIDVEKNTRT